MRSITLDFFRSKTWNWNNIKCCYNFFDDRSLYKFCSNTNELYLPINFSNLFSDISWFRGWYLFNCKPWARSERWFNDWFSKKNKSANRFGQSNIGNYSCHYWLVFRWCCWNRDSIVCLWNWALCSFRIIFS